MAIVTTSPVSRGQDKCRFGRIDNIMSTTPTPYKLSPLSFNSPRTSPFRRPSQLAQSPSAGKPTTPTSSPLRHSGPTPSAATPSSSPLKPSAATPTSSPLKGAVATPTSSPLKPAGLTPTPTHSPLPNIARRDSASKPPPWLTTRGTTATPESPLSPTRKVSSSTQHTVRPASPSKTSSIAAKFEGPSSSGTPLAEQPLRPAPVTRTDSSDALSKIPPPLLHSMRESFSVLDRDNNGSVDASDVADMLSQLGLTTSPSTLAEYFNGTQSINLATYLNTLSDLLTGLSHPSELNAAFEAFDDGDDGQIDLAELKDALLHTVPEPGEKKLTEREIDMVVEGFSGRRAFGKGGKGLARGEVFRYQEFVASITGGGGTGADGANAAIQS